LKDFKNITEDGKYIWIPFEKVDKNNVKQITEFTEIQHIVELIILN
jgi:protein involved in temperature-dependent protein secretion